MKYIKYLLFCLLMLPFNIDAVNAEVLLECDTYTLSINDSTLCKIVLNDPENSIVNFKADINVSSNLELSDVSINNNWTGTNSFYNVEENNIIYNKNSKKNSATINLTSVNFQTTARVEVGSFKFKVISGEPETNETVSLKNITLKANGSSDEQNVDDISKSIRIPSNNASLTTLEISTSTLTPVFSPDVLEYTVNDVTSDNINILATGSNNASISGTGNKKLNYGTNKFEITVKAESGVTKTYTINVNRIDNRSSDSTLQNIKVNNEIVEFDPNKLNYNITLPKDEEKLNVEATPTNNKATVQYSDNNRKMLPGELYTMYIYVSAENGSKTTYTLAVTRQEGSSNNNLKSLTVNNSSVNIKNGQSYTLTFPNSVTKAEISTTLEDSKATVNIEGNNNLKVGSNIFKIKVTAENEAIKTYTLTVIRKNEDGDVTNLSNNTNLKTLTIEDYKIDFKKDILTYNIEVENNVSKLDIKYTLEDDKASVSIDGNKNFKVGLNTVKIIVTAENGETETYTINVTKKSNVKEVENNKSKIISALKNNDNYEQILVNVNYSSDLIIPNEVIKELINSKKIITYNVLEEEKIKYSMTLNGSLFTTFEGNFDYKIKFNSNDDTNLENLIGSNKNIIFDFSHSGDFPTGTSLKMYVGNIFSDGSSLYLYRNNDLKELELTNKDLSVIEGYITVPLENGSTYVLLNTSLEAEPVVPDTPVSNDEDNNILIYVGISLGVLVIVIFVVIIILQKKKKPPKKESITALNNNVNISPNPNMNVNNNLEKTEILDLEDLTDTTEYLFGISVMDIKDYIEKCPLSGLKNDNIKDGIVVVSVDNNSPVAKAGIIQDDVLLEINNKKINNKENFKKLIKDAKHGNKYTIKYNRNGSIKKAKITI